MAKLIGKRLGQYEITRKIGAGGMGEVFEARDTKLTRNVAIKVLSIESEQDDEFVQRFTREANTAAALDHPNIITIYNVGVQEGLHYIAMRYAEGQTLGGIIRQEGALSPARALRITEQLAKALDYAHEKGVIHRDLKPANIMIGRDDHVTLMDFGIAKALAGAKLTRTGVAMGTPDYMSPEQFQGTEVDARSDVYSLGIVLYEMLTGEVPFTGDTPFAILHGHIYEPPPPPRQYNPQLSEDIEGVILRSLAKRPEDRYQIAGDLVSALRAAVTAAVPTSVFTEQNLKLVLEQGKEYQLSPGVLKMGREAGNDVLFSQDSVSRFHAEFRTDERGSVIVDLGSSNGTIVNGRQIAAHVPQPIHAGDQIKLGNEVILAVERGIVEQQPVVAPPPAPELNALAKTTKKPQKPEKAKKRSTAQSRSWIKTWIAVLRHPSVATFESIINDPLASNRRAYIWVFISSMISAFALSAMAGMQGADIEAFVCIGPVFGVVSVIFFAISVGITQLMAGALGGKGNYSQLLQAWAAIAAPITLISSILSLIPILAIASFLLMLYGFVLNIIAVKAVNKLGWAKSIVAVVIIPGLLMCVGIAITAALALTGPAIEDVFNEVINELQ